MPIHIDNIIEPVIPGFPEAYEALKPDLMAIPTERLDGHNTLDVGLAAQTVLGNLRDLARIKDDVAAVFGPQMAALFDALPATAAAAIQANVNYLFATRTTDLTELSKRMSSQHSLLFTDAMSLANRGIFDRQMVESYKAQPGYKGLYESLLGLAGLFRDRSAEIAGKTPVTAEMVATAAALAEEMAAQLGKRSEEAVRDSASEMRMRALTLLIDRYEQIRRMVNYVCWFTQDADEYAPSLWTSARRQASGPKKDDVVVEPVSPGGPPVAGPVVSPTDPDKDIPEPFRGA